jgi:hypothetical protein
VEVTQLHPVLSLSKPCTKVVHYIGNRVSFETDTWSIFLWVLCHGQVKLKRHRIPYLVHYSPGQKCRTKE